MKGFRSLKVFSEEIECVNQRKSFYIPIKSIVLQAAYLRKVRQISHSLQATVGYSLQGRNRIFASLGAALKSHIESEQLNLSYNQFHSVQVDVSIGSGLFMLRN